MTMKAVILVYQMKGICDGFKKSRELIYKETLGIHSAFKNCAHLAVRKE